MVRVFRTEAGRHVAEGDPEAAYLAFGEADELPDEVAAELGGKSAKAPANKARKPSEDKAS